MIDELSKHAGSKDESCEEGDEASSATKPAAIEPGTLDIDTSSRSRVCCREVLLSGRLVVFQVSVEIASNLQAVLFHSRLHSIAGIYAANL